MVNILRRPNHFEGSYPEDKQVIKNYDTEPFEEISDEELKAVNTEVFEEIRDEEGYKGFTGINDYSTNIPEIDYVISTSGAIYDTFMKSALLCGEYTGEYLPWGLKAISNAIKFTEEANIKVNGTTINVQKTISSFFGRDISFIQQACDKTHDAIEPTCKKMKVYCFDRIVGAAYKQGKCIDESPQEYDDELKELVDDKELNEIRAEPDTNVSNTNTTQQLGFFSRFFA
ncbi:hypothetical protein [Wolbachia endosymbiont of Folsomia candida]|uniref:hypothetical protein n=1 Tax=Wolbachia endosymbiont of Folsomia candida TaxID=169402 RepID=UPI000B174210|nr:hypothetical protein [Wolbachia endosymbiont of Folsomia candida]APR98254.1 hypothetical protein ASM33_03035 [Wolbachia endosymbiont of Folsomia candida]